MACIYIVVQLFAAAVGSLVARAFFGTGGNLAATIPAPGHELGAVAFEAILTFGIVLLVLSMANGPKLDGAYIPLAVGAYVMAFGTMGGPYDGAAFNPARAFGPDIALGNLSTYWVYPVGSLIGAVAVVVVATVFRGAATAQEAKAAEGTPLDVDGTVHA
jgi:aquaporin Z